MKVQRLLALGTCIIGIGGVLALTPARAGAAPTDVNSDVRYEVLSTGLTDPMNVQVAPDGRVVVAERDGSIKVWHQDGRLVKAGQLQLDATSCSTCAAQNLGNSGVYGLLLDRQFSKTGDLIVWYPKAGTANPVTHLIEWRLSRVRLTPNDTLDLRHERVLFRTHSWFLPAESSGNHFGGVLEWLPDGTLVLGTGDDINPRSSEGFGPRDDTKGASYYWNGEFTAQNPASPWGKMLRFMPDGSVPDGSQEGIRANPYVGKSILDPYIPNGTEHKVGYYPYGRPFAPAKIKVNPFVYSIGYKQPWRGAVDPVTGNLFFGEVGPDAQADDSQKGPQGYEEINVVPFGGGVNHGWPRCIGPNWPYHDYSWAASKDRGLLDCAKMTKPEIWYPTGSLSQQWPLVAAGLKTSEIPAIYPSRPTGSLRLPDRFAHQAVFLEFSRGCVFTLPVVRGHLDVDENHWTVLKPCVGGTTAVGIPAPKVDVGNFATIIDPIDAAVGRDGAIYVLEYGEGYSNNTQSKLGRIVGASGTPNPAADFVPSEGGSSVPPAKPFHAEDPVASTRGSLPATGGPTRLQRIGVLFLGSGFLLCAFAARRRSYVVA